ncbi:MAG: TlpA family protein disulfide reductase [Cyclobacteriaceae bacterium]
MKTVFYILLVLSISFGCDPMDDVMSEMNPGGEKSTTEEEEEEIELAPFFSLNNLDGDSVELDDFENKVLAMYFFGSGCPFCIAAGPDIQKMADQFANNNKFAIIGLDTWNGNSEAVKAFQDKAKVKFNLLLSASATAVDYDTRYDRVVIVNPDGEIVFRGSNRVSNELDDIEDKLKELLD